MIVFSSLVLYFGGTEGFYFIILIRQDLTYFQLSGLQILSRLQKVLSNIFYLMINIPLHSLLTPYILGPANYIPRQIFYILQGPLIPFPHLLPCLPLTKSPLPPLLPLCFSSKYLLLFCPHLLATCWIFLR